MQEIRVAPKFFILVLYFMFNFFEQCFPFVGYDEYDPIIRKHYIFNSPFDNLSGSVIGNMFSNGKLIFTLLHGQPSKALVDIFLTSIEKFDFGLLLNLR